MSGAAFSRGLYLLPPKELTEKKVSKNIKNTEAENVPENETRESGIVVKSPEQFRPRNLPLIVILPEGASKAQIERASVLNAYAYQYPDKWEQRKETLLKELEALKDSPDPVQNPNVRLSVGPKAPNL